jgi:hypothetical protein
MIIFTRTIRLACLFIAAAVLVLTVLELYGFCHQRLCGFAPAAGVAAK